MPEKESNKAKRKKMAIIILLVLGCIVLFTQIAVMFYVDPKTEKFIMRKVSERSKGQYTVRFENISINIFTQRLTAKSVYLTPAVLPDSVRKWREDEVELFIPEISMQGLSLWAALWDRKIVVSEIEMIKPRIKIKRNSKTDANPAQYRKHINYYRALKGIFNAALIKDFIIKDGYLELYRLLDTFDYVATIESVDLNLKDILLDSLVTGKEDGYVDIGGIESRLKAFSQRSPDSTYLLSVALMDISSSQSYFHVEGINLVPLQNLNEHELQNNIIYEVYVPKFDLDDIDLKQLYKTRQLKLHSVKVPSPAIKVMGYHVAENRDDSIEEVNFYPLISEYLRTLHIEKVLLEDARLDIVNVKENTRANLEKADIFLYDFKMDSSHLLKRDKLFYSERVFVKANEEKDPLLLDSIDFSKNFIQQLNQ